MNFLNFNNWEAYNVNNIKYINYDLKEKNKKTYKKNNILPINNQKLYFIDLYYKTKQFNKNIKKNIIHLNILIYIKLCIIKL